MTMNVELSVEPYLSSMLKRDQHLSLEFDKGYVHMIIKDFEDTRKIFDIYDGLATVSASASINGRTASDWNQWRTTADYRSDIFWEDNRGYVLQAFIGIAPSRLRLFRQIPAAFPRGNLSEITVTTLDDDAIGFVDGVPERGSPFDNPNVLTELFIPPRADIKFGIFNPELFTVQPIFHIPIRRHEVYVLNPDDEHDRKIINEIVIGKRRTKRWSPGVTPWKYDVQGNFSVKGVPWEVIQ